MSRLVDLGVSQRGSKKFPIYHPYRVPSKPKVVSMNQMGCHSTVNMWLWEESEYFPHWAGIPCASAPPNMAIGRLIMGDQIDGYRLSSWVVGLGESQRESKQLLVSMNCM